MATYTLNNIVDLIEAFRSSHLQLKSFYFGRLPDSTSEQDIEFPTLLAELQPSPISENGGNGEETFVFKFYVLDRADHNRANEKDTLSDCKRIGLDLIAYFRLNLFSVNLTITSNITMTPLIGALDDLCNGWEFDIIFRQPLDLNKCSIPFSSAPSTANPLLVTILDQDNNVVATVVPGGNYSVIVASGIKDLGSGYTNNVIDLG